MNLVARASMRARHRSGVIRRYALPVILIALGFLPSPGARAQTEAVYITQHGEVTVGFPGFESLAIYSWPDLQLQSVHPEVPKHDSLAISLDGRELYLFSTSQVAVLDRASLRTSRVFRFGLLREEGWADGIMIAPSRPNVVMSRHGYWMNILTGLPVQSPQELAPNCAVFNSVLDDSGRYVTLSLRCPIRVGQTGQALRVVDLNGHRVMTNDVTDAEHGAVIAGGRLVVARATTLEVIDLGTSRVLDTLNLPLNTGVEAISSDAHGGVIAAVLARGGVALTVVHWPQLQAEPRTLRQYRSFSGNAYLRVQRGKVVLIAQEPEFCLVGCFLGNSDMAIFDLNDDFNRGIPVDRNPILWYPFIADVALAPLARQVSNVPALDARGAVALIAIILTTVWWTRRRFTMRRTTTARYVVALFMLLSIGIANRASAQAQAVYVMQRGYVQIGFPGFNRLEIYSWPDFALQSQHYEVPAHDALALSLDGRELYLFSSTQVAVLDRASLRVSRVFTFATRRDDGWAEQILISPRRPDVAMSRRGYWMNLTTGLTVRSPADLAPNCTIVDSSLDDGGVYVTLSLSCQIAPGQYRQALRVVDLDGSRVMAGDIEDTAVGTVISGGRMVAMRPSGLEVLDMATLQVQARLNLPPRAALRAIVGDGRGGVIGVSGNHATVIVLDWPRLQAEPVVLKQYQSSGDILSLRMQRGKVVLLDRDYEICYVGCFLSLATLTVIDPDDGFSYTTPRDSYPFVGDAALMPLARQSTNVPTLTARGLLALVAIMLLVAWRARHLRAGT